MKYVGKEIYSVIPNRYPLMLLDTLEVVDNRAIAEITLKKGMWFFECHYPDHPILPLCLLVESMTQVFLALLMEKAPSKEEIPLIHSLGEMSPKGIMEPGDVVRIEATMTSFKRVFAKGKCKAYKNDEVDPILEFDIVDILPSKIDKMG